jgi:hypothetical protein
MNASNRRGTDMADLTDLARLLPAPAERGLPVGRQQALKDHLMSEVRVTSRPPSVVPGIHHRRKPVIGIVGAAVAALAVGFALIFIAGSPPGASPAAVRLLAKIATVAARQPSPPVRDSQFWYIKSWVSYQVCNGGDTNATCVIVKPRERQIWQSVSNQCVTGLLREDGRNIRLVFSSNYLHCPYRGGVQSPTYRFLQSLPTDPHTLLSLIERDMQGQLPRTEEAFSTIGDLLGETITPPRLSAALYRAAALIPGVTVVMNARDAIGRRGVAVALTRRGIRGEWIFSKRTLRFLGERNIKVADGSTIGESAILQRAFVGRAGQVPR